MSEIEFSKLTNDELVGELILAAYESGYYSAKNTFELVGIAVGKRAKYRKEIMRRLDVLETNLTPAPQKAHS